MKQLIFLVTLCLTCYVGGVEPIPVGKLDESILDPFLPFITQELNKEFALQNDGRTRRCTREYGYSFFRLENGDYTLSPIPPFFQELGELVCKEFGYPSDTFTNVILSYYDQGYHLEPHEDINDSMPIQKGYFFDEQVFGIVIEADATGHLFFVKDEINRIPLLTLEPVYHLQEEKGTIYCLEGPFRKFPYFHGVTEVTNKRISITFRKVIFERL